jgi:hypothetical protein
MEPVRELDAKLVEAKRWLAEINGCSRNKPSLARAQELVAWDPPPVYVSGLSKLKDAVTSAQNWLAKEQQVRGGRPAGASSWPGLSLAGQASGEGV